MQADEQNPDEQKQDIEVTMARPRLRWLMTVFAIASVLVALLLTLLPVAIEKGTVGWLQRHGVEDASIDNVDLNLFSGEAVLEGLKSGDGLNIDHLNLDFDWLPLWHHIVHIRSLTLSESSLHLLEEKGIWQIEGIGAAGIRTAGTGPETSDATTTEVSTASQDDHWLLVVDDLLMDAVNVNVKSGLFSLSLPLKSLHLSLSDPLQQQQKMVNSIEIGDTSFSGFGSSIHFSAAKLAGEITFSMLSDDVLASIKNNQLSIAMQGVEIRSEHDKRRISAATLKLDGVSLKGPDHIGVVSLGVDGIQITHALNGQGDVKLAAVTISGVNADMDGTIGVAKLGLKGLSVEGVDGHRQSVRIADTSLAGFSMLPVKPSDGKTNNRAAQHFRIKTLVMKKVGMNHVAGDSSSITLKQIDLAGLEAGLDGSVNVADIALQQLKAEGVSSDHQTLDLESGKLTGFAMRAREQIQLKALNLHKASLYVTDKQSGSNPGRLLGAFDQAGLKQFVMHGGDSGSFESFQLEKVLLPSVGKTSLGSIGLIRASKAELVKGGSYHVKQLKVDRLQARLVKRKKGWLLPPEISTGKPVGAEHKGKKAQATASKPAAQAAKPRVLIDEVVVGAGSRIALRDESVVPTLTTMMQVETFRFAPFDSSGERSGKLDVKMKLGKTGALIAKGKLTPLAGKQLRADLSVALKNVDLARLSGYVEADLGKPIKTGQFNLDSDLSIKNDMIDSKNKILIRKLELGDASKKKDVAQPGKGKQAISLAGGISIDMALGMLLDDRGDITLDVPVRGPLDDPDINLSHIINKALLTSLKTGALTYAALALQPYGSIILVADVASGLIKDAAKPALTPIRFAERKVDLSPAMSDYINKIASLLKKKGFRLQLCGMATRIEGEQVMQPPPEPLPEQSGAPDYVVEPALLDAQLLALAQARSDLVLTELRHHGIVGNRLFNCNPRIDEAKTKAEPRVELMLD